MAARVLSLTATNVRQNGTLGFLHICVPSIVVTLGWPGSWPCYLKTAARLHVVWCGVAWLPPPLERTIKHAREN